MVRLLLRQPPYHIPAGHRPLPSLQMAMVLASRSREYSLVLTGNCHHFPTSFLSFSLFIFPIDVAGIFLPPADPLCFVSCKCALIWPGMRVIVYDF